MTNREIDEIVHHDVMGVARPSKGWLLTNPIPHYSTDSAASKQVREKMRALGFTWEMRSDPAAVLDGPYVFMIFGPRCVGCWKAYAFTEEFAVSLAALCAVGVEVEGK